MHDNPNIWDDIYNYSHMMLVDKEKAEENNLLAYPAYKNFVFVPEIIKTNNDGAYTITPLTKEDAEKHNLKYSEHRIKRAAELNTQSICPPMLLTLEDYFFTPTILSDLLFENTTKTTDGSEFLILTNRKQLHGASALFDKGVIDDIHKILKQGFIAIVAEEDFCYIIPEKIVSKEMESLGKDMSMLDSELKKHTNMLWFPENSTVYNGKFCYLYTLTDDEIKDHPFISEKGDAAFYRFVIDHFCNQNYDEIQSCDCTKIDVAKNIQDYWFKAEEERSTNDFINKYGRQPDEQTINENRTQFVMFLAMSGPKAMDDLPNNTIRFSEDFITL